MNKEDHVQEILKLRWEKAELEEKVKSLEALVKIWQKIALENSRQHVVE